MPRALLAWILIALSLSFGLAVRAQNFPAYGEVFARVWQQNRYPLLSDTLWSVMRKSGYRFSTPITRPPGIQSMMMFLSNIIML